MLRGRWDPQTVSADWLLGVASELAVALAYSHAYHVAHGDVYAHNVLVDFAQVVALLWGHQDQNSKQSGSIAESLPTNLELARSFPHCSGTADLSPTF